MDATPLGLIAGTGCGVVVTQGCANPGLNYVSPLGLGEGGCDEVPCVAVREGYPTADATPYVGKEARRGQ